MHAAVGGASCSSSALVSPEVRKLLDQTNVALALSFLFLSLVTFLSWITTASLSFFSSVRSEDSKEVFLAIQVDGVTRARTAPLALRGPALSLNHAFHLELERAQLLRIVLLTPGEQLWDQNRLVLLLKGYYTHLLMLTNYHVS